MYPAPTDRPHRPHRPPTDPSVAVLVLAVLGLATVPALLWTLDHPWIGGAAATVLAGGLVVGFAAGVAVAVGKTGEESSESRPLVTAHVIPGGRGAPRRQQ